MSHKVFAAPDPARVATTSTTRADEDADHRPRTEVSLHRLLTLATLTPSQAAYVAVRVLDDVGHANGSFRSDIPVTDRDVVLDADGEAHLVETASADTSAEHPPTDGDAAIAVRGLVSELARNSNRPVVWMHPRDEAIRSCLEHCGNGGSAEGIAAMSRQLRHALDLRPGLVPDEDLRSELSHLVHLVLHDELHETTSTPGPVRDDDGVARVSWRHPQRVPTPRLRTKRVRALAGAHRIRLVPVAVGVVALLLAGAGVFTFLASPSQIVDDILHRGTAAAAAGTTTGSGRTTATTSPRSTTPGVRAPRQVPTLAPQSAGAISGVDLRALQTCGTRSACLMRLTARFAPAYSGEVVVWRVVAFDRCTGVTRVLHRGQVSGAPGSYVYDSASVRLPSSTSFAVIGLVDRPAAVASAALLFPIHGGHC